MAFGPGILVRSLSVPHVKDKAGQVWQYHSRSDRHSKVLCWGIVLDLLRASRVMQQQARSGMLVFGVNHEMRDFATGRKKDLDLVLARPHDDRRGDTLESLVDRFKIELSGEERAALLGVPVLAQGKVGSVLMALEAKAVMTAHTRALPRLYDELNSSHLTVHGASSAALAVAAVMINTSSTFLSSDQNKDPSQARTWSQEPQPRSTEVTVEKLRELPRRSNVSNNGYDAIGALFVDCPNDGSPVTLSGAEASPESAAEFEYASMIARVANEYDTRFRDL